MLAATHMQLNLKELQFYVALSLETHACHLALKRKLFQILMNQNCSLIQGLIYPQMAH